MTVYDIIEKLLASEGISSAQFAERMNIHPTTPYKWQTGERRPSSQTLRRIEKEFAVLFRRDRAGNIIGVDSVQPNADIDLRNTVPTVGAEAEEAIHAEARMIDMYEIVAQQARLPRWEDLNEETRDEVRAEIAIIENEIERVRREGANAIIKLIRRKKSR